MRLPSFNTEKFPTITATYVAAALVFGNTVLPLVGGPIKPYEIREFTSAVSALMNGETSTASLEPALYPERGGVQLFHANMAPVGTEGFQYASARVSPEETPVEFANLDDIEVLDPAAVTPAAQTFSEEESICIGACGDDEESLEALPGEEVAVEDLNTIEPKLVTVTPS